MFEQIIQFLQRQYPSSEVQVPTISPEQQKEVLDKLDLMTDFRSFYVVFDASIQKITHHNGVEKWLGYKNINFKKYIEAIHPTYISLLVSVAHSGYEISKTKRFKFMDVGLSLNLPLRKAFSTIYLICRRTLYPFQINEKGIVTAHLNHYVIIDEVDEAQIMSLSPAIIDKMGERQIDLEQQLIDFVRKKNFRKDSALPFSGQEAEILRRYAINEDSTKICEAMGITKNTLYAYNRRIINKTLNKFELEFTNAKDIAIWIQKQGISF